MRSREFITFLVEYRRDITAKNYGNKLLQALSYSPAHALPDSLYNIHTLLSMSMHPQHYHKSTGIKLDILGKFITISPDNAAEVLAQLKPQIIDTILAEIEIYHDPTLNKEYSEWLARVWANDRGRTKFEDLNRNDLLSAYSLGKRRRLIRPEHANINNFKTWGDFENTILDNYDVESFYGGEQENIARGNAKTVFEDSTVRIVVPQDEQAACYYGQGTQWCTAATRGTNYFDSYNRQGPLYILLPKNPTYVGEKYQLHFPSDQFMDETDTPAGLPFILIDKFPSTLEFFKQAEPEILNYIVFVPDEILAPLIEKIREYAQDYIWETISEWEVNDDEYRNWQSKEARERGYIDSDGDIDWDRVYEDTELGNYLEFNDYAYKFERDATSAINLTPNEVRQLAKEEQDTGNYDTMTLDDLDEVFRYSVENTFDRQGSSGLAPWIRKHILVYRVNSNSKWKVERT